MWMVFAAMTAGSMIGMLLVTLAVVPTATRCGVEFRSLLPHREFGDSGWIITVFLQYASIIGWNSLLLIFGKSVAQLLATLGVTTADSADIVIRLSTALACVIVFLVLLREGPQASSGFFPRFSSVIVGIGAWMTLAALSAPS